MISPARFHHLCVRAAPKFWARLAPQGDKNACWPWPGSDDGNGYGKFKLDSYESARTHRVAYALTYGPIPDGMDVLHSCDNPPCCNPAHLSVGSHVENMADMARKRRARGPARPGEKNPRAKLTQAQADEIKALIASGTANRAIAAQYPISEAMVSRIKVGKAWTRLAK